MIEFDVCTYLEADTTLISLLSITASDPKIYPLQAPQDSVYPYIVYNWGVGMEDELLDEDRIQLIIKSDSYETVTNIRERLKAILDLQDTIQDTTLTSTDYFIYFSKLTNGDMIYDNEQNLYLINLFFNVKFKKKI